MEMEKRWKMEKHANEKRGKGGKWGKLDMRKGGNVEMEKRGNEKRGKWRNMAMIKGGNVETWKYFFQESKGRATSPRAFCCRTASRYGGNVETWVRVRPGDRPR